MEYNIIQNKYHRDIIKKLCEQNTDKKVLIINDYERYKRYKSLMKNENIVFEKYFNNKPTFKEFELFSDVMSNTIIKNEAKKLKKYIITSKYSHLDSEGINELFQTLAENKISKQVLKDNLGKKMISFKHKKPEEFYEVLKEVTENLISWDMKKYLKEKISKEDIVNIDNEKKLILLEMDDISKVQKYGSNMWCIKRDEEYYKEYRSEGYRFYNLYDFNKPAGDKYSQIALVSDFKGNIMDAYLKNDDQALNYALENFDDYKFSEMNIEEIIEYLDKYESFKNQDYLIKFLKEYNNFIEDDFYISWTEDFDDSLSVDDLFNLSYPLKELQLMNDKYFLGLMKFLHTEDWDIEETTESLMNYKDSNKEEFYSNCIYKKLKLNRGKDSDKIIKLAENLIKEEKYTDNFIYFNEEFFSLEENYKKIIFDKIEHKNEDTMKFLMSNTPLEQTDQMMDYFRKDPNYEEHKKIVLNSMSDLVGNGYRNLEEKGFLAVAVNTDLILDFDNKLILASYLRGTSYFNKSRNEFNHETLINILKSKKDDFRSFFVGKESQNSDFFKFLDKNEKLSFDCIYGIKKIYGKEIPFIENYIDSGLSFDDFKLKDTIYFSEILNNESEKFKLNFIKSSINFEVTDLLSENKFNIFNEKNKKALFSESTDFLNKVVDLVLKEKESTSLYVKKHFWKVDLLVDNIEDELNKRKQENRKKLKNQ